MQLTGETEFFVQVLDNSGNVGVDDNKGAYHSLVSYDIYLPLLLRNAPSATSPATHEPCVSCGEINLGKSRRSKHFFDMNSSHHMSTHAARFLPYFDFSQPQEISQFTPGALPGAVHSSTYRPCPGQKAETLWVIWLAVETSDY